jgi:RNA polymerase sigma factor (TIGR02999 family)
LSRIEPGEPNASDELLPLVYDELRRQTAAKLVLERPGQTLQATALVPETYLRLLGLSGNQPIWNGRGHFFAAAAEAMRRILIDQARQKKSLKAGLRMRRVDLDDVELALNQATDDLLALDDALAKLAGENQAAADLAPDSFSRAHFTPISDTPIRDTTSSAILEPNWRGMSLFFPAANGEALRSPQVRSKVASRNRQQPDQTPSRLSTTRPNPLVVVSRNRAASIDAQS